jgi:hypothetical protein
MAAQCEEAMVIMAPEKRRFCRPEDSPTSIGCGDGPPDDREKAGVMESGPQRVITEPGSGGRVDPPAPLALSYQAESACRKIAQSLHM